MVHTTTMVSGRGAFAVVLAALLGCSAPPSTDPTPPSQTKPEATAEQAPSAPEGPAPEPLEAIVVDKDPRYGPCGFRQFSLQRLLLLGASGDVASAMTEIHLVKTAEEAVGETTRFEVLHTFKGPPRTNLSWEHGGTLHPVNALVEPRRVFVFFDLAPIKGTCGGQCCLPTAPFIRNASGGTLRQFAGTAAASDREIAEALVAVLPFAGVEHVIVDVSYGREKSSITLGSLKMDLRPPRSTEEQKMSARPVRLEAAITVSTAVRVGDAPGLVVVSGWYTAPIEVEPPWPRSDGPPREHQRFQIVTTRDGARTKVLETWFDA